MTECASRQPVTEEKALIFLHIPKAAGTTLHIIIERQYPNSSIFTIDGANVQKSIHEFKNLPEKERQKIRCLKGHMPFGLHKYIPWPVSYITLLRNPVNRIISHYYYVLRNPNHYLYNEVTSKNMSLRDYVRSGISPELTNGQTKLISGVEKVDSVTGNEPGSADILEIAKKNLQDHFIAVGLSEKFNESLVLFKRLLGWKNISYIKQNVARSRPSKREIPRRTIEVIEKHNELDKELYKFAKQMFEEQIREQEQSFKRELRTFQVLNFRTAGLQRVQAVTCEAAARAYLNAFDAAGSMEGHGVPARSFGQSEPAGAGSEAQSAKVVEPLAGRRIQSWEALPAVVLICGMHRSGTSALARVLNLHGVSLGQSLLQADPANERGYWEHDELWRLDERILAALGREWSDPGRLPGRWWERPEVRVLAQELIMTLRRDFGGKALWGVKDPRICRLMPLWREAAGQMGAREHFVIVLRRPGEVAASLARRDGMPPERTRALWLRYMLEAERHTRGASRAFITYDQLLADWRAVLARVVEGTGLDLVAAGDEAAAQVDEFLSPQLRHHRTSPGSGIDTGVLAERAEAVYEILAAEDGALDFAALDRAAEELDALEDAFAGGRARTIIPVAEPADRERGIPYREWCNLFGLHESDGQVMAERMMQRWRHQPVIHLIVVLRRGEGARLAATLDSLSTQIYAGWGLTVLAEEPCPDPLFTQIPNVEWRELAGDRTAALNAIVGETESDWVGLLRPGDRLAQHALFACADRLQGMGGARWLYTDWDRIDEAGDRCDPRFERDADLDWFRTGECLGGLWLIRRDALLELGGFAGRGAEEARDLALHVFERFGPGAFGHVDEMLCHRPAPSRAEEECADTGSHRAVLAAHLRRVAEPGEIAEGLAPGTLRVRYPVRGEPPVSLIVDTTDDLRVFEQFVETLRAVTKYPKLELVVVDCGSRDEDTHEYFDALRATGAIVVSAREGAGRAEAWNTGARAARGEYLIFADRRTGFVQKDWVEILLGHAQREGVGIAAPRVVGSAQTVMHSALILGFGGPAGDAFQGLSVWDPGHGGRALTEQGCSAVPPACLLVSRACFEEAGGFDAERFPSDWFSVDFCLRAEAAGRRTVWTPYALVGWQSPEPAREAGDAEQEAGLYERWLPRLVRDPFYHRDLSLSGTAFQPRTESTVRWNPVFHDRPRILGVPADTLGCGEYRILAPLNALDDAARAQCGVLAPQEGAPRMPSVVEMERLAPDTLLLQGALHDVHLEALRRYRRFNRAFRVFDIEDLKSAVPEKNSRRKFLLRDVKARTRKALALCDRLLATTEPLAEAHRGLIDDIRVVPIYLSRDRWGSLTPAGNEGGRPRVGWAGGQQHEGDLEILLPVVEATAQEVDWVFFGMCPAALRPYVREVHDLVPFAEYPARLAALALDLAVAPLEDHPFNVAKSNLRLLEYGMLGWPVVCTDLEPYRGAPVTRVTNDPQCWIEAIRERVHDLDAARSEGARLHEWVLGGWMLEDHLDEWMEALSPDERTGVVVVGRSQKVADGRES